MHEFKSVTQSGMEKVHSISTKTQPKSVKNGSVQYNGRPHWCLRVNRCLHAHINVQVLVYEIKSP